MIAERKDPDPNVTAREADLAVFGLQLSRLELLEGGAQWTRHPDVRGVFHRVVHTDVGGDRFVVLLRLAAGARLGAADVRGMHEVFVVSGAVEVGGVRLAEGSRAALRVDEDTTAVPVLHAPEVATLLVRGEGLEVLPT